jgi:hypothetical protein
MVIGRPIRTGDPIAKSGHLISQSGPYLLIGTDFGIVSEDEDILNQLYYVHTSHYLFSSSCTPSRSFRSYYPSPF